MKLAIEGHPERGKEVIKLLEMMGGKNDLGLFGSGVSHYYITDNKGIRNHFDTQCLILTLEQFERKFPFKICDNVSYIDNNGKIINTSILSMSWNEEKHTMWYKLATGATKFVENIWKTMKQKELKDYLKPGYVVEYEEGNKFVITQDVHGNTFGIQLGKAVLWASLTDLDSITKVYQIDKPGCLHMSCICNSDLTLVWEKKEVELTMQQIADKFGIDVNQLKIKK